MDSGRLKITVFRCSNCAKEDLFWNDYEMTRSLLRCSHPCSTTVFKLSRFVLFDFEVTVSVLSNQTLRITMIRKREPYCKSLFSRPWHTSKKNTVSTEISRRETFFSLLTPRHLFLLYFSTTPFRQWKSVTSVWWGIWKRTRRCILWVHRKELRSPGVRQSLSNIESSLMLPTFGPSEWQSGRYSALERNRGLDAEQ